MVKDVVFSVLDYFTNPAGTIEKAVNNSLEAEKLGIVGLVMMFFSTLFTSPSRIDTGVLLTLVYILLVIVYTVFIIGFAVSMGKKPIIDIPKVFWFLVSIGIVDALVILFFPLSLVAGWVMPLALGVVFFVKLYYLIGGISAIFRVSKSTALVIILSPYVIVGVLMLLFLVSSYITLSGAVETVLLE